MVDFSLQSIIEVVAQAFFSGSIQMAGIAILLACMLVFIVIFASIKAPAQYGLIPALILSLFFASYGIIDTSVAFIIVVITAVLVATTARGLVSGGS